MTKDRRELEKALSERVLPVLRERGFRGSLPHLRRATEHRIDLVSFELARGGDGYDVRVAVAPPSGIVTAEGEHVPPEKLRASQVDDGWSTRLGPLGRDAERFEVETEGGDDRFEVAATLFLAELERAEAWWEDRGAAYLPDRGPQGSTIVTTAGAVLIAASVGAAVVRLVRSEHLRPWARTFVLGWGLVGLGAWLGGRRRP